MESEKYMNAGEGLVNLMPTEKLVVVGRLPISMPLYGSDADNFVHHNTTSFAIGAMFFVFCRTKLCNSRFLESANGKPLEGEILQNANSIPITHCNGVFQVSLAVKHAPQKDISKFP